MENLLAAWEEFRRGKGSKSDVQAFEACLEDNIVELHRQLVSQLWQPSPYKPFYITDPKVRHIHKACVPDRVVHQAIFRLLYPIFDKSFIFDSYSCRVNKGTHRAVKRLETFCRRLSKNYRQPAFVLKCDIKKFFDSVDHKILVGLLNKKITNDKAMALVNSVIASFSSGPGKGLPLGNVTSQLFANVYMNEFDQFIKYTLKVKNYIRYTDDFVIAAEDAGYLPGLLTDIIGFSDKNLKLKLHPKKVFIRKLSQGVDFLGYIVLPHHLVLRTKTKRRVFKKLVHKRELLQDGKISEKSFYQSKQAYLGILTHCKGYGLSQKIISMLGT